MNTIKKYKWILISLLVIIVILGGSFFFIQGNRDEVSAEGFGETAEAFTGSLAESATASGQVNAEREASLSLPTSGIVHDILVNVGDPVIEGDTILKLDSIALERAVVSAKNDVIIAEARLANLLAPPSDADLASAEAAVANTQTTLDNLLSGPSAEEIAASEASIKAAQANVWASSGTLQANGEVSQAEIIAAQRDLQDALDTQKSAHDTWVNLANCDVNSDGTHTCTPKEDNARMDSATENVRVADAQVAIAQAKLEELENPDANNIASSQAGLASSSAQYDAAAIRHESLLAGATDADIAAAEADLASAQASFDKLVSGPDATDIKIYETRVAQAETALQEAQNNLAEATLIAPFAGTVTAVHTSEGELATGPIIEILDDGSFEVILNVDEVDIGQLSIGQPAIISMETWPDVEIPSEITRISPTASPNNSGVVTFEVHLSLGETDLPIRPGMTANADLITAVGEDVLLVPNAAIKADRANSTYSVDVVNYSADGVPNVTSVTVVIGLKDSDHTQIIDGLEEGDTVTLGSVSAPVNSFGGFGGGRQGQ